MRGTHDCAEHPHHDDGVAVFKVEKVENKAL